MKLFRSTKSKMTKNENGEKIPHSQIIEAVLVHYNIGNNIQEGCTHLFVINCYAKY